MVGYVFTEGTPEYEEKLEREAAEAYEREEKKDWLFRDPLRPLSIDQFPYKRDEGELKLDFIFKGMMYGPMIGIAALFESPFLFLFLALWVGVNFLRRNS